MNKLIFSLTLLVASLGVCIAQKNYTPGVVVSTYAGSTTAGSTNAQFTAASFYGPYDVAFDAAGNMYIADAKNHMIRKITIDGAVSTLAGSTQGYENGQGTQARFNNPIGIAVDAQGYVYVADRFNYRVRKISPTGLVSSLAGNSNSGQTNGQGAQASFNSPMDVVVDGSGIVYVADDTQIRKITANGDVSLIAGSMFGERSNKDGQGTNATFGLANSIAMDKDGYLYIADSWNYNVRKISPSGMVSLFAGSGDAADNDGTGADADFWGPQGIAVDPTGNVYVADSNNDNIRMITPTGVVTTLAGTSSEGSANGEGSVASFKNPTGIAVDASGNLFVTETENNQIRKLTLPSVATPVTKATAAVSVNLFPNPANEAVTIVLPVEETVTVDVYDNLGSSISSGVFTGPNINFSTALLQNGMYVVKVTSKNALYVNQLLIAR